MAPRKNTTKSDTGAAEKKTRERKEYAPVSLDALKPVKVTKEEKVQVLPGRERSEEQKAVDAAVKDLAYDYLNAGAPKAFRDMPILKYTLPTAQAETVRFMIQKAGNLLNCKIKFGRPAWDEGNEVVTFAAIPRDASQWTDTPPAEESSEEPGDGEPTESEPTPEPTESEPRTEPAPF